MARLDDWEARLIAYLDACRLRPFAYGKQDCALFASGAVLAVTGSDPGSTMRGRYRTAAGASRALGRLGYPDVLTHADAVLGPRIGPLAAGRGDIVSDGVALGVMWVGYSLFAGSEELLGLGWREGLVPIQPHQITACWKVG